MAGKQQGGRVGDPVLTKVLMDQFAAFTSYCRVNIAVRGFTDDDGKNPAMVNDILESTGQCSALIRNCLTSTQQMLRAGGLPQQIEDDLDVLRDWCIQTGDLIADIDYQLRTLVMSNQDYADVLHSYLDWYYREAGMGAFVPSEPDDAVPEAEPRQEPDPGERPADGSDDYQVVRPGPIEESEDFDDGTEDDGGDAPEITSDDDGETDDSDDSDDHDSDEGQEDIEGYEEVDYGEDEGSYGDDGGMDELLARLQALEESNNELSRRYDALATENEQLHKANQSLEGEIQARDREQTVLKPEPVQRSVPTGTVPPVVPKPKARAATGYARPVAPAPRQSNAGANPLPKLVSSSAARAAAQRVSAENANRSEGGKAGYRATDDVDDGYGSEGSSDPIGTSIHRSYTRLNGETVTEEDAPSEVGAGARFRGGYGQGEVAGRGLGGQDTEEAEAEVEAEVKAEAEAEVAPAPIGLRRVPAKGMRETGPGKKAPAAPVRAEPAPAPVIKPVRRTNAPVQGKVKNPMPEPVREPVRIPVRNPNAEPEPVHSPVKASVEEPIEEPIETVQEPVSEPEVVVADSDLDDAVMPEPDEPVVIDGMENAGFRAGWDNIPSLLTDTPDPEPVIETPQETAYASTLTEEPEPPKKRAPAKKKTTSRSSKAATRRRTSKSKTGKTGSRKTTKPKNGGSKAENGPKAGESDSDSL